MGLFRRLLLFAGLPFSLVPAAIALDSDYVWPWVVIWATAGAVAYTGVATRLALWFFRRVRGSGLWSVALVLLQFIAALVTTVALTFLIYRAPVPRGVWRRLPDPPSPAIHLQAAGCTRFFGGWTTITTARGERYRLEESDGRTIWRPDSLAPVADSTWPPCADAVTRTPFGNPPAPPNSPVELVRSQIFGADCSGERAIALGRDGTLWSWEHISCAIGEVALGQLGLVWITLVGLVAWIVSILSPTGRAWRRRSVAQEQVTSTG